jgi:hypothetical protein
MLARTASAPPTDEGWSYEPKLDGDRCLVDTHGRFRARSRRGWAMAELAIEAALLHALRVASAGSLSVRPQTLLLWASTRKLEYLALLQHRAHSFQFRAAKCRLAPRLA